VNRRSIAGAATPQRQQQQPSALSKHAGSPALFKLATSQAGSARQQLQQNAPSTSHHAGTESSFPASSTAQRHQQQMQQAIQSPGVRFSTPAPPQQQQQKQQQQSRRIPVARKSTDLLRIRDPELRCLAIMNSPMIDCRPRGRRSLAASGRHSICCVPNANNSLLAASPQRPPRLTQPAADDGTSPQAVWRTLFCDVEEADEDEEAALVDQAREKARESEDAIRKYRMLLHQQWELIRFLIDDWKEVSISESVPQSLLSELTGALAAAGRLIRDTLPAFEAKLVPAGQPSPAQLHATWSNVEADIVDTRRRFAQLEACRLGGWPPAAAESAAVDERRRVSGQQQQQQRRLTRRSLQVA
ncbi:hypothetical protein BOX15_Mlig020599g2, partial [Macrostomum lignano]